MPHEGHVVEVEPSYDEFKPVGSRALRHRPTGALITFDGTNVTAEMAKLESSTSDGRKYAPDKVIAMATTIMWR
jgi:hypothetical protein